MLPDKKTKQQICLVKGGFDMEILNGVLKEELERLKNLKKHYAQEMSKLPKGSLIRKKINGNIYYYFNYRDGKKNVFKYIGKLNKDEVEDLRLKIEKRRKLRTLNIKVKKDIARLLKIIQEKEQKLFFSTLKALHKSGALDELILIGSWCHFFYRRYFNNAPEIPVVRTLDIDFLVPNPRNIRKTVNIPKILKSLDFVPMQNYTTGYTKYVHPELELEFLTPDLSRGKGTKPYEIPKLHINAQGLRYLNLLQAHTTTAKYKTSKVHLPEPAAYVLHKLIVFERRTKKGKKERDLMAAKAIGEFLLKDAKQRAKLKAIFAELPKKWQKTIINNLKKHSTVLYNFFINNKT